MDPLTADDIHWQSDPVPRLEDVDWLLLTESETWAYLRELQADHRIVRELMHVALAEVARLTRLVKTQSDTIRTQNDILKSILESDQ